MSRSPEPTPPPPPLSCDVSEPEMPPTPSETSRPRSPSLTFAPFVRLPSDALVRAAAAAGIPPPPPPPAAPLPRPFDGDAAAEPAKILRLWKERLKREAAALEFYKAEQQQQQRQMQEPAPHFMQPTASASARRRGPDPAHSLERYRRQIRAASRDGRGTARRHRAAAVAHPRPPWQPPLSVAREHSAAPAPPPVSASTQTEASPARTPLQLWAEAHFAKGRHARSLVEQAEGEGGCVVAPNAPGPVAREEEEEPPDHELLCPLCLAPSPTAAELLRQHLPQCSAARDAICARLDAINGGGGALSHAEHEAALLRLQRDLLVEDAGRRDGREGRRRFHEWVAGVFNPRARQLCDRAALRCPMGALCSCESNTVPHAVVAEHAARCWTISFTAADFGDAMIGRPVSNRDRQLPLVTVADALVACAPDLRPWVLCASSRSLASIHAAHSSERGRVIGIVRRSDDAVIPVDTTLLDAWCCAFRVHFL